MEVANDGLNPNHTDPDTVNDEIGDEVDQAPDTRFEDLNAKFDMLVDGFNELRGTLVNNKPTQEVEEELEDDEPLTGSKVNKIVNKAIRSAVTSSNAQSQRTLWDNKAKDEFPIADPQFQRELKKVWTELQESGLDTAHPKALYVVAKTTAQKIGVSKKEKREVVNPQTTESPSTGQATQRQAKKGMVAEDDPRVRFYSMKGGQDPKKLEALRVKLFDKDQKKVPR